MAKRKTKKKAWKKFEITKVKLNPEQAVLSCCDNSDRAQVDAAACKDAECVVSPAIQDASS